MSREHIADSVELVMRGHAYDATVCIGGCDKNLPAMMMAILRLDVPAGKHVFARPDLWSTVYANGGAQPGDVYGSGAMRVQRAV